MGGLLFFGVIFLWIGVAIFLARRNQFIEGMAPGGKRQLMTLLLMAILIPLPVADEIIGGFQFRALCDKYAVQYIDEKNARDRKVLSVGGYQSQYVENTILKIRIQPWIYQDVETKKTLVSYHSVEAEGGWLIRGISETKRPVIFKGYCAPDNQDEFKKKFNITVIN
jgi:hypothetical protein